MPTAAARFLPQLVNGQPHRNVSRGHKHLAANNASWALERFLKGHIDAALTISNAVDRETEAPRERYVRKQLVQFLFVTREVH
jgi:hypothetical protein